MKTLFSVILAALVLASPAYAGSLDMFNIPLIMSKPPEQTVTVPLPYQQAHRNLVAAIYHCHTHSLVTGFIYTDNKTATINVSKSFPDVLYRASFLLTDTDGATKIDVWVPALWFGNTQKFWATGAEKMATEGAKVDCLALGFPEE